MSLGNDTIEIEVIALLDPKSGGVINEKQFTKELTKELKTLIKNTESTLKELNVNPVLAVNPSVNLKNKRQFLAQLHKNKKSLIAEANKVYKNLSLDAKAAVHLNIDQAQREFQKQLSTLERTLTAVARSRGKAIGAKVSEALGINIKAATTLTQLRSGQRNQLQNLVSRTSLSNAARTPANESVKFGREVYKQFEGRLDKVKPDQLPALQKYLAAEQKRLIKRVNTAEAQGKQVRDATLSKLDRISGELADTGKKLRPILQAQERMAARQERLQRVSEKVNTQGAASVPAGKRSLVREALFVRRAEVSKDLTKALKADNLSTASHLKKEFDGLGKSIGLLDDSLRTGIQKSAITEKRKAIEGKLGADSVKRLNTVTSQQNRTLNQLSSLLNDKKVLNSKGAVVKSKKPENIAKQKALLTALEDANKQGLVRGDTANKLTKQLATNLDKFEQSLRSPQAVRGKKVFAKAKGQVSSVNAAELGNVKAFLREELVSKKQAQRDFFDQNNRYSSALDKQIRSLEVAEKTTGKAIRSIADGTQRLQQVNSQVTKDFKRFSQNPEKFNESDRSALLRNLKEAKTLNAARLKDEGQLSTKNRAAAESNVSKLEKAINKVAPTISRTLGDADKSRLSRSLSQRLLGQDKGFSIPSQVSRSQEKIVTELRDALQGETLGRTFGKKLSDITDQDIARLGRVSKHLEKAEREGLISARKRRLLQDRIKLKTAGKTAPKDFSEAVALAESRAFAKSVKTGQFAGAFAPLGAATGQQVEQGLTQDVTRLSKSIGAYQKTIAEYQDRISRGDFLGGDHKQQLEGEVSRLRKEVSDQRKSQRRLFTRREEVKNLRKGFIPPTNSPSGQISLLLKQFARLYVGFAVLGTIIGGVVALIQELVVLDANMKSVQAAALGTSEQMVGIKAAIQSVGVTTKFSVGEISEAAKILVQADVAVKDIPSTLRATANFAAATDSEIGVSADLITSFSKVYKDFTPDEVASLLTKTVNLSKLAGEDFQVILGIATQTASTMGLTGEQFLAAVAVLRNQGLKASTVATGLRQVLNEVFAPDAKTLQVLSERYKAIGENLSGKGIREKFASFRNSTSPLIEVLSELKRLGFGGSAKTEFSRFIDIRAENALNALINNLDKLREREAQLPFGDAALRASSIQLQSLAASLKNLGAATTVLADDVFDPLIQSVKSLSVFLTEAIKNLHTLHNTLVAGGNNGLASAGITSILGGVAGAALTRGRSLVPRIGGIAAGAAGGAVGGVTAAEFGIDIGALNLAMGTALTLLSFVNKGFLSNLRDIKGTKAKFAAQFTVQKASLAAYSTEFPALIGATASTTTKATGAVSRLSSSVKLMWGGLLRFLPVIGQIASIAFLFYDLLDVPSGRESLIALKKQLVDSQEKIDDAQRRAAQFVNEDGATAASVFARQATAVESFMSTLGRVGIKANQDAQLLFLVEQALKDGLDNASESYKTLADYLIKQSGGLLDKQTVGDTIRTITNLKRESNESLKAAITGLRSEIDGLKDKLANGQVLSTVEQAMLQSWDNLIYTNADLYRTFMGNLSDLGSRSMVELTAQLQRVKAEFAKNTKAAADAIATQELAVQNDLFGSQLEQQKRQLATSSKNIAGSLTSTGTNASVKDFLDSLTTAIKTIADFAVQHPSPTSEQEARSAIKELQQFAKAQISQSANISGGGNFGISGQLNLLSKSGRDRLSQSIDTLTSVAVKNSGLRQDLPGKVAADTVREFDSALRGALAAQDKAIAIRGADNAPSLLDEIAKVSGTNADANLKLIDSVLADKDALIAKLTPRDGKQLNDNPETKQLNKELTALRKILLNVGTKFGSYAAQVTSAQGDSVLSQTAEAKKLEGQIAIYDKGLDATSRGMVDRVIDLEKKALERRLETAQSTLSLVPKDTELGFHAAKALEARTAVEAVQTDLSLLAKKRHDLLAKLQSVTDRKLRKATRINPADRDKERAEAAANAFAKKVAQEELKALKLKLQNLKFDPANTDEAALADIRNQRAALIKVINQKELERDRAAARSSEKYLAAELKAKAEVTRRTAASERLTSALEKNAQSYNVALDKRALADTKQFITGVQNQAKAAPNFLTVNNPANDRQEQLLRSALATKELLKRFQQKKTRTDAERKELTAAILVSSDKMTESFKAFVGDTSFGRQLAFMQTLIDMTRTSPFTDALLRLPDTLSTAIINPFFESQGEDQPSLGVRVRESVKAGLRAEAQAIATEYFKQGVAGILSEFLGGDLAKDPALKLQSEMLKATQGNTRAQEKLTVAMLAVAENKDVRAALEAYEVDNPEKTTAQDSQGRTWQDTLLDWFRGEQAVKSSGTTVKSQGGAARATGENADDESGIYGDFQDAFRTLFNPDSNLFQNIGEFFSELFGKDSTIGGSVVSLFAGLFNKDSDLGSILKGFFASLLQGVSGGKTGGSGGFLGTLFSVIAGSSGSAGKTPAAKSATDLTSFSLERPGVSDLPTISQEQISHALVPGAFSASPPLQSEYYQSDANSSGGPSSVRVEVVAPENPVYIGSDQIEQAINTREGRQAISHIVQDVKDA